MTSETVAEQVPTAIAGDVAFVLSDPPYADRGVARLRLVAAIVTLLLTLWILVLTRGAGPAWVLAGLVLLAAAYWGRAFLRANRSPGRRLVVTAAGLSLEAGAASFVLRWAEVTEIRVDHDALVLRVITSAGEHVIEPPLAGHGLEALAARLAQAPRGPGPSLSVPSAP